MPCRPILWLKKNKMLPGWFLNWLSGQSIFLAHEELLLRGQCHRDRVLWQLMSSLRVAAQERQLDVRVSAE